MFVWWTYWLRAKAIAPREQDPGRDPVRTERRERLPDTGDAARGTNRPRAVRPPRRRLLTR